MELRISRRDHDQLLDWAKQAADNECCGLIFGQDGDVHYLQLTANLAPDSRRHFEIDPVELIAAQKAERTGSLSLLGYFHSHPNGRATPSQNDADMAAADGRIWLIVAANIVSAWEALPDGNIHGRFNPISLVIS
jgi:proteasome lid subunit RPN8/RPN11